MQLLILGIKNCSLPPEYVKYNHTTNWYYLKVLNNFIRSFWDNNVQNGCLNYARNLVKKTVYLGSLNSKNIY